MMIILSTFELTLVLWTVISIIVIFLLVSASRKKTCGKPVEKDGGCETDSAKIVPIRKKAIVINPYDLDVDLRREQEEKDRENQLPYPL